MPNEAVKLSLVSSHQPVKLHIGCGGNKLPGYINADYHPGAVGADVFFDATKRWPFADNSLDLVYSSHFIEHLEDFRGFFKEAWRCLRDNGKMNIRAPFGSHHYAWVDVTHVRPWFPGSFCFLQPNYIMESRNPQHEWTHFFGVDFVECLIEPRLHKFMRWPFMNTFLTYLNFLPDAVLEFQAFLYAIKTPYTMNYFLNHRKGNEVTVLYVKNFQSNHNIS